MEFEINLEEVFLGPVGRSSADRLEFLSRNAPEQITGMVVSEVDSFKPSDSAPIIIPYEDGGFESLEKINTKSGKPCYQCCLYAPTARKLLTYLHPIIDEDILKAIKDIKV